MFGNDHHHPQESVFKLLDEVFLHASRRFTMLLEYNTVFVCPVQREGGADNHARRETNGGPCPAGMPTTAVTLENKTKDLQRRQANADAAAQANEQRERKKANGGRRKLSP